MPKVVAHPLSARIVLLAAAACLALSVVWAMVAAEMRDTDARPAKRSGATELRAPAADEARGLRVAVRR
jgi:hypothetical protein